MVQLLHVTNVLDGVLNQGPSTPQQVDTTHSLIMLCTPWHTLWMVDKRCYPKIWDFGDQFWPLLKKWLAEFVIFLFYFQNLLTGLFIKSEANGKTCWQWLYLTNTKIAETTKYLLMLALEQCKVPIHNTRITQIFVAIKKSKLRWQFDLRYQ